MVSSKTAAKCVAVIDLGSNSVRFEVFSVLLPLVPQTPLLPFHRGRYMPRLGQGLTPGGPLQEDAKERARGVLREIKEKLLELQPEKVIAVATSALREASDGEAFLRELEQETGIAIRCISGAEEAALTARGIINNEQGLSGPLILVDIGGGSTEISYCRISPTAQEIFFSQSLLLGAIHCQNIFLRTAPPPASGLQQMRTHVREVLSQLPPFPEPSPAIIGSSGTIRALCKLETQGGRSTKSNKQIHELVERMSVMTVDEISNIPGSERNRADIILAGSIIFTELMDYFGAPTVTASEFSLRHGLLDLGLEEFRH